MTCLVRFVESQASDVYQFLDYSHEPLNEEVLGFLRDDFDEEALKASGFLSVVTLKPISLDGRSRPGFGDIKPLFLKRRIEPLPGRWLTFIATTPLLQFLSTGRFWMTNEMVGTLTMGFTWYKGQTVPAGTTVALVMISDPRVRLDHDCTYDEAELPGEEPGKQALGH